MNLNWNKNYELNELEILNIDKNTYIQELKEIINGFEEQIPIKFKNKKTISEYQELIKEIKEKITEIDNTKQFKLTQDKVKFLNALINLRKKLYILPLTKKIEIFMKYVNNNEIPTQMSNIRFYDLEQNTTDDTAIGKWYLRQIYSNLETFKLEIEKYKNTYPIAYEKIENRIKLLPNERKITNTLKTKVEILMQLLEEGKISLPIKDKTISFEQITPEISHNSTIKNWFHNITNKEKESFLSICFKNKEKYPKAYKIIQNYLEKENKDNKLDNETRTKLLLKHVEKNKIPVSKDKITFNDIEPNCKDFINAADWLTRQFLVNINELKINLEKYKDIYPKGYIKINNKINKFCTEKRMPVLTNLEKEELFMKYINENELPTSKSRIKFKDIVPNSCCEYDIYNWTISYIFTNNKTVLNLIKKYKEIYPKACIRIERRMYELKEYRETAPIKAPFELKVEIFIKYIEENKIPSDYNKIRFCEIEQNIKDTTLIGNWFRDQLSKNINNFYNEINKYKDIYPKGYLKIINRINNSEIMLKKQRKLLLNTLKQMKQELILNTNTQKYNISR